MGRPPSPADAIARSPRDLPGWGLTLVTGVHASVFAVAAVVLPWRSWTAFSFLVTSLAALHLATGLSALAKRAWLPRLFRALAWASVGLLAVFTWQIVAVAWHVIALYGGIGGAITAGLLLFWGWLVLLTVPIAAWGFGVTAPARKTRAVNEKVLVVSIALAIAAGILGARPRPAEALHDLDEAEIHASLSRVFSTRTSSTPGSRRRSLFHLTPARCPGGVSARGITILVTYRDAEGEAASGCLSGSSLEGVVNDLAARSENWIRPIKVDVLRSWDDLGSSTTLLDPLLVRPAVDGICAEGRCLAPWQLVALDAFVQHRPLDAVADARFGVSHAHLRESLGVSPTARLLRIETSSYVVGEDGVHSLSRLRAKAPPLGPETVARAVENAEAHIVSAQLRDGKFRYTLDPYRGTVETQSLNLPRQAGTLLALCEVGRSMRRPFAVRRAAAQLAGFARPAGEGAIAITDHPEIARLGGTALPLIALASCREIVGDRHDALLVGAARLLLRLQRPDGSFHPEYDLAASIGRGSEEALYAAGQAVFGLVLVEKLAGEGALPEIDRVAVGEAVRRAMNHYAGSYWTSPLADFFFLEENWHCLAARAALDTHRNDRYERFCLDYVAFKSRLILESEAAGDPSFLGGYGLGKLFPPHNTATAGFGETLAAAIAVRQARGMDVTRERALLRKVLGFLLRAQWDEVSCFACTREHRVLGGFSEHFASPIIRIDYVQHAMAALGHGARALGWEG